MRAIRTLDLTKFYHKSAGLRTTPALQALNLDVGENEVFGFLGRNGAGKTTTIKLLCSLIKPNRGESFVFDQPVRSRTTRRLIGYLPENPYFYEYLTPRETIDFYGRLQGLNARSRGQEWEKLSNLLDLVAIGNQRVREFSKGMRQRLAFAVALVGDPQLLILDEPMSGLDPLGRRVIRELILKLRDEKKAIFFSSHVLSDVEQICDRVGILVKGTLVVQGRLDELLGDKVQLVEVTIGGISETAAEATLDVLAASARQLETGRCFTVPNLETANVLAQRALAMGGKLLEFTPVRESLEDYFVQRQEEHA